MVLKGEDLLYNETSPRGTFYYIVDHPGGRSAMGDDPLYDTVTYITEISLHVTLNQR